jgi:NADPH:quinone reductase-like Zn-dependent oxidoreductase
MTVRAIVVDQSAPGRVAIHEVADPEPDREEALVEVNAISLNRGEVNRILTAHDGWRPGWDVAGRVLRAAPGSPPEGTRVVGLVAGAGWAERVAVPAGQLAALPDGVSDAEAAALPVAGVTALRLLRQGPDILGRRVLITGAAGGVGRFAIQLAHRGGAHVTAVVGRPERAAGLRELGADEVVVGHQAVEGRYDLVLESVGGDSLATLVRHVDPSGTLVMFGSSSKEPTTFDVRDVYLAGAIRLVGFTLFHALRGDPPARDLKFLAGLVAAGELDAQVAAESSWEQLPEALERLNGRTVPGKLVLRLH